MKKKIPAFKDIKPGKMYWCKYHKKMIDGAICESPDELVGIFDGRNKTWLRFSALASNDDNSPPNPERDLWILHVAKEEIVEMREIIVKDLPLYIGLKHKSRLFGEFLKDLHK